MSISEPLSVEDEFANRDEMGLQPISNKTKTEGQALAFYAKLTVVMVVLGQCLAWGLYFLCAKVFGQQHLYDSKFAFIREYQLGYVYLGVWLVFMMRWAVVVSANGARAAARVDRPDQHVYRLMAKTGNLRDAPYVMMANTGAQGRFNRAQRGVYNTDETFPALVANTILTTAVFGPATMVVLLLVVFGRIKFAVSYKKSCEARGAGFMPSMLGEQWLQGMTLLCAIKGIFGV